MRQALFAFPSVALVVAMSHTPQLTSTAAAATTATLAAVNGPADDDLARAEKLYREGKAAFETAETNKALELWQEAYSLLPDSADVRPIKNDLVYNMAKAQVRAYKVDHDAARLRKAKLLFEQYITEHEALHGSDDASVKEREAATKEMEEVDTLLAEAPAGGGDGETDPDVVHTPPGGDAPGDPSEGGEAPGSSDDGKSDFDATLDANPDLKKRYKSGRSMIIAGSVLGGVGALGTLGGLYLLVVPENVFAGAGGIGLLAFGGATLVTGSVLLGVGVPRFLKARSKARGMASQTAFAPWVSPYGGGVTAVMRF